MGINVITDGRQSCESVPRYTSPVPVKSLPLIVKERPAAVLRGGFTSQQRNAGHA